MGEQATAYERRVGGVRKAAAILREEGAVAGGRSIVCKLLARAYHTEHALVLKKRLDRLGTEYAGALQSGVPAEGWEVREAKREEILAFAHKVGVRKKVSSYLARGDRCFLAFLRNDPIGMVWWVDGNDMAARGHAQADRFGIGLRPDEVYSYDLYVVPEQRGGGAGTAFFAAFEEALRERGYSANYGWVDETNQTARWLYRLRRFETERTVTSRVVLRWLRLTDGRIYVGPDWDYRRVRLRASSQPPRGRQPRDPSSRSD